MIKIGIYCIENTLNHKKYIGQAKDIYRRWEEHKNKAFNKREKSYNSDLYKDIRNQGLNTFNFYILEECKLEELDEKEIYWINFYQTYPPELGKGYNIAEGGHGASKIPPPNFLNELFYLLKYTDLTQLEIADKLGITQSCVSTLNSGKYWKKEGIDYPIRKCSRAIKSKNKVKINYNLPSKEELLYILYNYQNLNKVASYYGCTTNNLKIWMRKYNISSVRLKYINLYRVEYLHLDPIKESGSWPKVAQIDPDTKEIIQVFDSQYETASYLGLKRESITGLRKAIKENTLYKGYLWKHLENTQ